MLVIRIGDIIVWAQIYKILFEKQILPRIDRQEGQNLPQSVNDKRKENWVDDSKMLCIVVVAYSMLHSS